MFDVILFTDMTNSRIPIKAAGAYKIAQSLRHAGYKVKVINNLFWTLQNDYDGLMDLMHKIVSSQTKVIGFSTTFLSAIDDNDSNPLVDNSKNFGKQLFGALDFDKGSTESSYRIKPEMLRFLRNLKESFNETKLIMGGESTAAQIMWKLCDDIEYWIRGMADASILKFMREIDTIPPGIWAYDTKAVTHDFRNDSVTYIPEDAVLENEPLTLELSRGCRFKCKFCSYPMLGRSPKDETYLKSELAILRELEHNRDNFGTEIYTMLCDTFNESTEKLLTVQRAIQQAKINIRFFSYLRIDLIHKFPDQINILRDMGVAGAHFGIESLNHESAKAIGKGLQTDKILETLEACKRSWGTDTIIHSGFIVGLPHDTQESVSDWVGMLERNETPLTSWALTALYMQSADRSDPHVYSSTFDLEAEKWGYERSDGEWSNEHWSYSSAFDYVADVQARSVGWNERTPTPHTAISMLGLDYTWYEVYNANRNFGQMKPDLLLRAEEKRRDYWHLLRL